MGRKVDDMSVAKFAGQVLRRGNAGYPLRRETHPLRWAVDVIRRAPAAAQSAAPAKLISALAASEGRFRAGQPYMFEALNLHFGAEFVVARAVGGLPERAWHTAGEQIRGCLPVNGMN